MILLLVRDRLEQVPQVAQEQTRNIDEFNKSQMQDAPAAPPGQGGGQCGQVDFSERRGVEELNE